MQLVKSFNREKYPYSVQFSLDYNGQQISLDALCASLPFYSSFRETTYIEQRYRDVVGILNKAMVDDYTLTRRGNTLQVFLKDCDDQAIVIAGMKPGHEYETDFIFGNPGWSNGKLRRTATEIRTLFNQTDMSSKVSFNIDKERKAVRIHTANGHDFVTFWGTVRRIEQQHKFRFQDLVK